MLDHFMIGRVVLVSDYQKGVVTRRSMAHLLSFAQASGVPAIVDPKVPHIEYYSGAALVTPNHVEAESATDSLISSNEDARRAGIALRPRIGVGTAAPDELKARFQS